MLRVKTNPSGQGSCLLPAAQLHFNSGTWLLPVHALMLFPGSPPQGPHVCKIIAFLGSCQAASYLRELWMLFLRAVQQALLFPRLHSLCLFAPLSLWTRPLQHGCRSGCYVFQKPLPGVVLFAWASLRKTICIHSGIYFFLEYTVSYENSLADILSDLMEINRAESILT